MFRNIQSRRTYIQSLIPSSCKKNKRRKGWVICLKEVIFHSTVTASPTRPFTNLFRILSSPTLHQFQETIIVILLIQLSSSSIAMTALLLSLLAWIGALPLLLGYPSPLFPSQKLTYNCNSSFVERYIVFLWLIFFSPILNVICCVLWIVKCWIITIRAAWYQNDHIYILQV